jgi:hypothetical protein
MSKQTPAAAAIVDLPIEVKMTAEARSKVRQPKSTTFKIIFQQKNKLCQ